MTANKYMSHLDYLQSSSKMLGRLPLFTFLVLVPPPSPPRSMLDKTKLFLCVIVVSCPNIELGGGGRRGGGYSGEEQIICFEHRYKAHEMDQ